MLLLIDAASLAYRAYHAIPSILAPDPGLQGDREGGAGVTGGAVKSGRVGVGEGATETNAVHGFLNFLARLIRDRRPSRLVVALDADWRPGWRVRLYPGYKSHRVAAPGEVDPVDPQVPIIVAVLDALGLSTARAADHEAEDVIATLAQRASGPIEIVTGDRDLFALVRDPDVRVLFTLRGVSELALVDEAWIAAKYGIPGRRYLDYALLRGDPSDGLPGVRGIGEKTAATLLARYGSLDALLAAADLSPTLRARLRASGAYLAAARRIVSPVLDAPVVGGDGAVPATPARPRRLKALAERYGLAGAIDRVTAALDSLQNP